MGKKFLRTQLLRFAANAHVELMSMEGLLANEARSEFTPTKAVYICADQPVTSFFACGKAANHTFRMGYKPLGTAAMRQTSLNDVVKCHECSGGSK